MTIPALFLLAASGVFTLPAWKRGLVVLLSLVYLVAVIAWWGPRLLAAFRRRRRGGRLPLF